ncbi:MAG: hypothetical protein ACRCXB_33590 [Aeromonadaceae bacterium]
MDNAKKKKFKLYYGGAYRGIITGDGVDIESGHANDEASGLDECQPHEEEKQQ